MSLWQELELEPHYCLLQLFIWIVVLTPNCSSELNTFFQPNKND